MMRVYYNDILQYYNEKQYYWFLTHWIIRDWLLKYWSILETGFSLLGAISTKVIHDHLMNQDFGKQIFAKHFLFY